MSNTDATDSDPDLDRSRDEKLKALIRKDIDPAITTLSKRALRRRQEGSS